MTYNIYYKAFFSTENLFDISESRLQKLIAHYMNGDTSFTISGEVYGFDNVSEFKIFMNESGMSAPEVKRYFQVRDAYVSGIGSHYVPPAVLSRLGSDVTDEFLEDLSYGCKTKETVTRNETYVNPGRIDDLKNIRSTDFDMSKLIRMCEELNSNWQQGNYYTVGLLVRSIINHVPPIFGAYSSFDQVIGGYGGASFKKIMRGLNESLRSTADHYTHALIRRKEPLPNDNQVDYRQNFDILLSEIISLLG